MSPVTLAAAALYVLSGICQPFLMVVCKTAGLADSRAQLYMLAYYAGPSCLLVTLLRPQWYRCCCCGGWNRSSSSSSSSSSLDKPPPPQVWYHHHHRCPSLAAVAKAALIAGFDIAAQSLNYTGASMAGATTFAVIYSSVTVWTAIFSFVLLGRELTRQQGCAVVVVFAGLCITGFDSFQLGSDVAHGAVYVFVGSCMHGATYVMSEAIMEKKSTALPLPKNHQDDTDAVPIQILPPRELLSIRENAAIQGVVACSGLLVWQFVYTASRWDELILQPMVASGTTVAQAACILAAFGVANLLHSVSFYHTLAHYPGGSTSAGVMKGLQAVLVFVAAHFLYCSRGNRDMCFSTPKFLSLITVVGGVVLFIASAEKQNGSRGAGYTRIGSAAINETV